MMLGDDALATFALSSYQMYSQKLAQKHISDQKELFGKYVG